eukprot:gene38602-46929_t
MKGLSLTAMKMETLIFLVTAELPSYKKLIAFWIHHFIEYSNPESPMKMQKEALYQAVFRTSQLLAHVTEKQREVVYNKLYWPLFSYLQRQYGAFMQTDKQENSKRAWLVGLSAPQGCGKTTMTQMMQDMFAHIGVRCTTMSLDDFYLTAQEQQEVARKFPLNPLVQYRGNAGTHDVPLLRSTLFQLQNSYNSSPASVISIPRYDKSLHNGRGDRAPRAQWPEVAQGVDMVMLEGWMLGFRPLPEDDRRLNSDSLKELNSLMRQYVWLEDILDQWVVVSVPDIQYVYEWRLEAEHKMMKQTGKGMSDSQVRDFVSRFMPAYELYLPALYQSCSDPSYSQPRLKITVGRDRMPVSFSEPILTCEHLRSSL